MGTDRLAATRDRERTDEPLPPGSPVDRRTCLREQIHLMGGIQPHGVLLCARTDDDVVVQASAGADELFGTPVHGATLASLLGTTVGVPTAGSGPAATRADRIPAGSGRLTAAVDVRWSHPDPRLTVVELEPVTDDGSAPDMATRMRDVLTELGGEPSVDAVLDRAVRLLRKVTGFDRVWAYRFEADGHGVIVAEDAAPGIPSFLGLHYPADDVPPRARELYLRNRVRVIPDAQADPVPLVPQVNPVTGEWLDQSDGELRAVSPIHLRYLRNMRVRASLSVAIEVDGRLWGLLSGHGYGGPVLVPPEARALLDLLGLVVSLRVGDAQQVAHQRALALLERHHAEVIEAVAAAPEVSGGLESAGTALLGVVGATGAVVRIGDDVRLIGATPPPAAVGTLLDWLDGRADVTEDGLVAVDSLAALDPAFGDLADVASGVLAVALSRPQRNWIAWLRPEYPATVVWGVPAAPVTVEADGELRLAPRESYELWRQSVEATCRPWTAAESASARRLLAALGAHVIARAEELARMNARLVQVNEELDAFTYSAAHDLKEPLRGIHIYAGFLAEDYSDVLDDAGRERLSSILRLSSRMGVLLDSMLEYARLSREELDLRPLDLADLVAAARELVSARLAAAGGEIVLESTGPPGALLGDRDRLVDVLANLFANAVKYRSADPPRIRVGVRPVSETLRGPALLATAATDAAPVTAVYVSDNGIGIAPEHFADIFRVFRQVQGQGTGTRGETGVGAGLGVCRRIVHRHGGVIWVESEPGRGATFYFTLSP